MSVDVAVVSYGAAAWLRNLLASLAAPVRAAAVSEIHVWENASPDESAAVLERFAATLPLRIHRSATNLGHGPALDRLLRERIRAREVLLLDSDAEVVGDLAALGRLDGAVFAGQVHPDPPQLYAYLCHLLLDREAYLALPPFSADGAPALAFFAAVEERGLPWRRLPFRGLVRHHGQGSLRGVVRRREGGHPFYRYAVAEGARDPDAARRSEIEAELARRLAAFLAGEEPPPLASLGDGLSPLATAPAVPRAARFPLSPALLPASTLAARANRLGLGLSPEDALALARRLRGERARRVLEVGTRHGGALFLASRAARREARLVTIDLPDWELDDPGEATNRERTAALVRPSQPLVLLRADPLAPETLARAADALDGPADVLLLDARRLAAEPGAAAVWAMLVRPGGLVAVTGGAAAPSTGVLAALGHLSPEAGAGGGVAFFRA